MAKLKNIFIKYRKQLIFGLFFLLIPIILRIVQFIILVFQHSVLDSGLFYLFTGFITDIVIFFEFYLLIIILQIIFEKVSWIKWFSLFIVFFVIQAYVLLDFFLFIKTGVRMQYTLLHFITDYEVFLSSANDLGIFSLLLAIIIVIFLAIGFLFFLINNGLKVPHIHKKLCLQCIGFLGGAIIIFSFIPAHFQYTFQNVLYADQALLFKNIFENTVFANKETNKITKFLPKYENFRLISDEYTLLRETENFIGEKIVNISIPNTDKPNVVLLFLESFRAQDVGVLGGKYNVSPVFDELSKQGILYNNFYTNGVQTTRAVLASLFGVVPHFSTNATQSSNYDLPLIGLHDLFKKRGYHTAYIHNGSLDFEDKDKFFLNQGFETILGRESIKREYPDALQTSWGIHDEYLMQYSADWLEKNNKQQPIFLTMFSVSNHHPWNVPNNFETNVSQDLENDMHQKFIETMSYSDFSLGKFVEILKEKGLYEDTILIVLSDTGQAMGEHNKEVQNYLNINHLYDEYIRSPLLILSPKYIKEPKVVDFVSSQIDIFPTIMDMFSWKDVNHSMGTSLLRNVDERIAVFNNPFAKGYWGWRKDNWKCIYYIRSGKVELYNLKEDPQELNDISSFNNNIVDECTDYLQDLHKGMFSLYKNELFSPEEN